MSAPVISLKVSFITEDKTWWYPEGTKKESWIGKHTIPSLNIFSMTDSAIWLSTNCDSRPIPSANLFRKQQDVPFGTTSVTL